MPQTIIVVPCYNEASRLDVPRFRAWLEQNETTLLFVNDGSKDDTLGVLQGLRDTCQGRVMVLDLPHNMGKAEAVRHGFLEAFQQDPQFVGFWDADLATPLEAIPEFEALLKANAALKMVFGARIRLLGRSIERHTARHYLGRIFATAASMSLGLPIYDTQCGAKLFRNCTEIRGLFADPFIAGWVFDVELIARYIQRVERQGGPSAAEIIHELPLQEWHDVAGSKVKSSDFVRGALSLARIYATYLR